MKIRNAHGDVAVYMPRSRLWRVVSSLGWGRQYSVVEGIDIPLFMDRGAGWPGALVGFQHGAGMIDGRPMSRRGDIKAIAQLKRWRAAA